MTALLRETAQDIAPKPIWKSKVFWFNIVMLFIHVSKTLPIEYAAPADTIGNILLRFVTDRPVTIVPTSAAD